MDVHNTVEDIVISMVSEIFFAIEKGGNPDKACTCDQCRMDVIIYVLNRTPPHYILSNRGAARVHTETIERQQLSADITSLIHDGLKRVNHNLRPNTDHSAFSKGVGSLANAPVFNIPTIMGRLFNGSNFAPLSNVSVELYLDGNLVPMKDANWQNPFKLVSNTEGNFNFWPAAIPAVAEREHKVFEFSLRVSSPDFEDLNHFFGVPVESEPRAAGSFQLSRTFKLSDLYMFPPGGEEEGDFSD